MIVEEDEETAFKRLEQEAIQGNSKAQAAVGLCYSTGQGVAQNDELAVKWFSQAAAITIMLNINSLNAIRLGKE